MANQLFSSMHTHTQFCDGGDTIETMCRAAYENKLYAIGFSAHAPIAKKTGIKTFWHLPDENADEYASEVRAAKKRWKGKLEVFLGLEVDYIKGMCSPNDGDFKELKPDYIIGSVHYVVPPNGAALFTVDGSQEELAKGANEGFNGSIEAIMHCYYDAIIEMIELGGFDILGHADIIKKNCMGKNLWSVEAEAARQKDISNLLSKTKITVEVNTGGINRGKINEVYPSLPFLRLLRENNIPVIITADAHNAKHINGNYDVAVQTLINAGYKEHCFLPCSLHPAPFATL